MHTQHYAIFANGTYWGKWPGESIAEAMKSAVEDVGTGDIGTDGLTAIPVSAIESFALDEWAESGSPAGQFPLTA